MSRPRTRSRIPLTNAGLFVVGLVIVFAVLATAVWGHLMD